MDYRLRKMVVGSPIACLLTVRLSRLSCQCARRGPIGRKNSCHGSQKYSCLPCLLPPARRPALSSSSPAPSKSSVPPFSQSASPFIAELTPTLLPIPPPTCSLQNYPSLPTHSSVHPFSCPLAFPPVRSSTHPQTLQSSRPPAPALVPSRRNGRPLSTHYISLRACHIYFHLSRVQRHIYGPNSRTDKA